MNLKGVFTKDLLPARAIVRELPCRKCGHPNELPTLFCEACGAARLKLGQIRVTVNLTLTMAAFLGYYYFQEVFSWPWPLYVLYSLFFLQIALFFVWESRVKMMRFTAWIMVFLGALGYLFEQLWTEGPVFMVLLLRDLPAIINSNPQLHYPILVGVIVIAFLPLYFRWGRVYGWVNAYRIALLALFTLFASVLIVFRGLAFLHAHEVFPNLQPALTEFVRTVMPEYRTVLAFLALGALRLFLFEVFVFAAVRGYAVARTERLKLDKEKLANETGFTRSLLFFASVVRRFVYAIEQMVIYLVGTLRILARDLAKVILAFLRELLVPSVALIAAAILIHQLALLTRSYIAANSLTTVGWLLVVIASIIVTELVFLTCKSRYRFKRILAVHGQLLGWLVPNFLVFFLLMSASLYGTTAVLAGREGEANKLPFAIGMLTISVGIALAALVMVILFRKRSLFAVAGESAAAGEENEEPPMFDEAPEQNIEDPEDEPEKDPIQDDDEHANKGGVNKGIGRLWRRRRGWDLGKVQIEKPATSARIARALGSTSERIKGSSIGQQAKETLKRIQGSIEGKSSHLDKLDEAKRQVTEKVAQIGALDSMGADTVTDEVRASLRHRYQKEAEALIAERDRLQAIVDEEYASHMNEKLKIGMKLAELQAKRAELDRLLAAGALAQPEHARQTRFLDTQIQFQQGALQNRQRLVSALASSARAPVAPQQDAHAG